MLNYKVAAAVMKRVRDYSKTDLATIGIDEDDLMLLASDKLWTVQNRRQVLNTLDALMYGTTDALGLARPRIPAEMQAAFVASYVEPVNRLVACIWMSEQRMTNGAAADYVDAEDVLTVEPASVHKLTNCVLFLVAEDRQIMDKITVEVQSATKQKETA